jgi:hypothetical protein
MDDSTPAKDGGDTLDLKLVRERYSACVEHEEDLRAAAVEDVRFVNVPGEQWEPAQKKKRGNRPSYEFNLLRQHCRQVQGDQRQARPSIRVRAVEDDDAEGAQLRQGLILNIEGQSNADRAYDTAFQFAAEGGFGCWRIVTEYSSDDAWEQDILIKEVRDPFAVWFDPAAVEYDRRDAMFAFFEETISEDRFKTEHPDAAVSDFEAGRDYGTWFRKDGVRRAEYWVKKPVTKTLLLLSNGKTVDAEEVTPGLDELAAQGVTVLRERKVQTHKVCMYLVSGAEVLSGPHEWPGKYIPLVPVYGDLIHVGGRDEYSGIVRHAKDAQRLVNYTTTTAMESVAKLPKNPYLVTPKMLEGKGVMQMWQRAATEDPLFLAYTPDAQAPGGRPIRENGPEFPAALVNLASVCQDLTKGVTGIHDVSRGDNPGSQSGKAILALQNKGDVANFNYQDNLSRSIRYTGEILLDLIPKVYDTERCVRVLGLDGGEKFEKVNATVRDEQTGEWVKVNDLSAGKYDVTVTTGPSFSTQRAEMVELMNGLFQSQPQAFALFADLFFKALDAPQAQEMAERAKFLLPPPLQQQMAKGKELPPEAMLAMQQAEQAMQQAQMQVQALQQAAAELKQDQAKTAADKAAITAQKAQIDAAIKVAQADLDKRDAEFQAMVAQFDAKVATTSAGLAQREAAMQQKDPAE